MTMAALGRIPCKSSITIYEPQPEYRNECPYVLIVCNGPHKHPIPIPLRTPDSVLEKLNTFLAPLSNLPNLTAHCLLGNKAAKLFLKTELLLISNPTFFDLHPSLANLDHLQVYINKAICSIHPHGTGWEGNKLPLCCSFHS